MHLRMDGLLLFMMKLTEGVVDEDGTSVRMMRVMIAHDEDGVSGS